MLSILRYSVTCRGFCTGNFRWRLQNNIFQKCDLQTVKQNIRIRKYHFTRRKNDGQQTPLHLYVKIGVGITTGMFIKCINANAVFCKASAGPTNTTRLIGVESSVSEPSFNWVKFWELLKPYYLEFIGAVIAALACAVLNIQIPRVLGDMINVLSHSLSSSDHFFKDLKLPAVQTVVLYSLNSLFTFIYIHLMSVIGEGIAKTLKVQLFASIMKQDIAFFDSNRTGEILNRLTVDITDFKSSFKQIVSQGLRNGTQILGCTVTLFLISPQMTAAMLVVVPSVIITGTIMGALLRKISFEAKAQSAKVTLVAEEAVSNIRTVRAFAMEDLETRMFDEQADLAKKLNVVLGRGIAMFQAGTNLFLNGMVLSTIYLGGYLVAQQQITPGDLMAFLVAVQMLQRSFTQLSLLFGTYIKGKHAGARVFEMIDLETSMNLDKGVMIPYHSLVPDVEFHDVHFSYPSRPQHEVLRGLTLKIPVGKTVAIVGASGSGKSTLAWLLERFYDVEDGIVLVGGQPLQKLNPTWLRGRVVGFISQEPVLFATSVMENIRYGRPTARDDEVVAAAKLANAHDFISEFPQGYDTMVGERGTSVSGGQKQRIAIARALLKNPSILILDEATSALDSESEKQVQEALDAVTKSRTTIVIAHRLSTIKNADLIVVLHAGRIAEMGTHSELMKVNGMYATLVRQQQLFSST